MQAPAPPHLNVASRQHPRGQAPVAVASLGAGEQLVIQALRAARARSEVHPATPEPLPAAASAVGPALERYARVLKQNEGEAPATAGNAYLTPIEAHTLRAIACMRAGLLGDAWRAVADICSPGRAGDALIALEEVAGARGRTGPSILA